MGCSFRMAKNVTPDISLLIFAKELLMKREPCPDCCCSWHAVRSAPVLSWNISAVKRVCSRHKICLGWTLLTEVSSVVARWARNSEFGTLGAWSSIYLRAATSAQTVLPLRCCGGPCAAAYLSITSFSFGTFSVSVSRSHFILFLVKTESIFPSLPIRQRFSQLPAALTAERQAQLHWACYDKLSLTLFRF